MPVNYLHPHLHCNEQEPAYMHTSPLPNTHTRQTNMHMNTKFKKKETYPTKIFLIWRVCRYDNLSGITMTDVHYSVTGNKEMWLSILSFQLQ